MSKKVMILVLTMALTLSNTALAHADQTSVETGGQTAAAEPSGSAGSANGTESTDGAGGTDSTNSTNGTDGTLPAGSGENVQAEEPAAEPAPAQGEDTPASEANAEEAQKDAEAGDDAKADVKDVKKETKTKQVSKYQKGLAAYIRSKNPKLSKNWSITLAGYFIKSGKKNKIDPKVLMALAQRESNFRAKATSRYGYKGIMQCSSAFAKAHGYQTSDLYQADVSIEIAAKYLRKMKNKHETYSKAIACFVCGSGAVARGVHSKEPGRSVMKTRSKIQTFLEEKNYV